MKVLGLTGGIGSGKSVVAAMFRDLGAVVLDADQVARDVVSPGTTGLQELVERFGTEILGPDGGIDRAMLGKKVFADPQARADLEAIVHPRVYFTICDWVDQVRMEGAPLAVIEIPLLFETQAHFPIDATICVLAGRAEQIERAKKRSNYDDQTLQGILDAQMDPADKSKLADHVIDNNGTLEETRRQVMRLFANLTK